MFYVEHIITQFKDKT